MKRYLYYLCTLTTGIVTWLVAGIYGFSIHNKEIIRIFYVFPFLTLIYFGCYCLLRLGWDLLMFNDFPFEVDALAKVCFGIDTIMYVYICVCKLLI